MAVDFSATGQRYSATISLDTTNFTIMLWCKRDADRNTNVVLASLDDAASGVPYALIGTDATGDLCYIEHNTEGNDDDVSGPTFDDTNWFFLCFTRAGTGANSAKFYYASGAAALSSSQVTMDGTFTATRFTIGDLQTTGEWWDGKIACVKLWSVGLTQNEVENERWFAMPQRTANCIGCWPLLIGGAVAGAQQDFSGAGNTLSGGTGSATGDPPFLSWRSNIRKRVYISGPPPTPDDDDISWMPSVKAVRGASFKAIASGFAPPSRPE